MLMNPVNVFVYLNRFNKKLKKKITQVSKWIFFQWACQVILILRLKKVQQWFELEQPFLESECIQIVITGMNKVLQINLENKKIWFLIYQKPNLFLMFYLML